MQAVSVNLKTYGKKSYGKVWAELGFFQASCWKNKTLAKFHFRNFIQWNFFHILTKGIDL